MYIIAGLGNPTREYEKTRHNVGFDTIDVLADKLNTSVDEKKFKGLYGRGIIAGEKVILLKPQTFMNLSGESVREAADFYKVDPEHIIVIYDDISLDVGQLRIRKKGSADDIIVKFMLNEKEVSIPVKTDIAPFYHWKDVRAFYKDLLSQLPDRP